MAKDKRSLVISTLLIILITSTSCSYNVIRPIENSNTKFLLPPNTDRLGLETALKNTSTEYYTIKIKIKNTLDRMGPGDNAINTNNFHFYEDISGSSRAYSIYAKKKFLSKKYNLFILLNYTSLLTMNIAGSQLEVDKKKLAILTDNLRTDIAKLAGGDYFGNVYGQNAIKLQLRSTLYREDVLDNVFQEIPLPLNLTLSRYSFRTSNSLTYNDILPGMVFKIEEAILNEERKSYVQRAIGIRIVTRSANNNIIFSNYAAESGNPTIPPAPAINIRTISSTIDYPRNWFYAGFISPANFRPSEVGTNSRCQISDQRFFCYQTIIGGNQFEDYKNDLLPVYPNSASEISLIKLGNCTSTTCVKEGQLQDSRIVLRCCLQVKPDKLPWEVVEMEATKKSYESSHGGNKIILKRKYRNRYRRIKGENDDVFLHLFDKIKN